MPKTHTLTLADVERLADLRAKAYGQFPDLAPMRHFDNEVTALAAVLIEAARLWLLQDNAAGDIQDVDPVTWTEPIDATEWALEQLKSDVGFPVVVHQYAAAKFLPVPTALAHYAQVFIPLPCEERALWVDDDGRTWLKQRADETLPRVGDTWISSIGEKWTVERVVYGKSDPVSTITANSVVGGYVNRMTPEGWLDFAAGASLLARTDV